MDHHPTQSHEAPGTDGFTVDRSIPRGRRRTMIVSMVVTVASLVSGVSGLIIGFVSNAWRGSRSREWLEIGPTERLNAVTFERYVLRETHQHGWQNRRVPHIVYVKDLYPDDPIALLSVCSHLGCTVQWKESDGAFRCPCHGGVYDDRGEVVKGPPPEPLTRMEVKIEKEVCYVRMPESAGKIV